VHCIERAVTSASEVLRAASGEAASLRGWVLRKNQIGGLIFLILRDGSGYVQVSGRKGISSETALKAMRSVSIESAVQLEGVIKKDDRAPGGREVSITSFQVIAKADNWPITKTAAKSPSFLYDMRHLSIRGQKVIAVMKIREEIIGAVFDFFRDHGFHLISAPSLVQAAVEGGATLFSLDYFGKKAFLSQSAQFYEEAALPALEKVWIFQPAFRAEKSRTPKHVTEFWMVEAEQAFADFPTILDLEEKLLALIARRVLDRRRDELGILGREIAEPHLPLKRMTYDEARENAKERGIEFAWGDDLPTEAERAISLTQPEPFFITDYPLSARSFYHATYDDRPDVTRSADLIAPEGIGELATGGQRIDRYEALLERIKGQGLSQDSLSWYLDLRRYGMPPHSGFGIGVERTTRWIAGLKHIRGASLFPRTPSRISP
jgi:asparaginyl-tRNA synthetase